MSSTVSNRDLGRETTASSGAREALGEAPAAAHRPANDGALDDGPGAAESTAETGLPAATDRASGVIRHSAAPRLLTTDLSFVAAFNEAGLLAELDLMELARIAESLHAEEPEVRCLDLLEHYYDGDGNAATAVRRRMADHVFLHRERAEVTASALVERVCAILPTIGDVRLERIGGDEGPLVLRSGEDCAAVVDDRDADDAQGDDTIPGDGETITVRGIVRGLNRLLGRRTVRDRLLPVASDGGREVYALLSVSAALGLCSAGFLDELTPESTLEFGAW